LTETGKRENEAGLSFAKSIGQVKERGHGAASGLNNILNPVQVAKKIAEEQSRLGIFQIDWHFVGVIVEQSVESRFERQGQTRAHPSYPNFRPWC
jgi:hypothetical protein